jgi:hypothetical protein
MRFRNWLAAVVIVVPVVGCNGVLGPPPIVGSGVPIVEGRDCTGFDGLQVSHAIKAEVEVEVGADFDVRVSGDDNIVPLVETDVLDEELRVRLRPNTRVKCATPLEITIQMPALRDVDVSGASSVIISGDVDMQSVEASGASKVVAANVTAGDLDVDASGASRIELAGTCESITADASGASTIDLKGLSSSTVAVDCSGASSLHAGITESLSGGASGASTVTYAGETDVAVSTSGASAVKTRD